MSKHPLASEILPVIDWSMLRTARPVDVMLPLTGLWIGNLPDEARPEALVEASRASQTCLPCFRRIPKL